MIVVDASVLIAHLDDRDALHERASALLIDAVDVPLGASPITLAEVLVGPGRANRLREAQAALDALEVHEIPLDADAAAQLASLRAATGLKLPDCCVLLAARQAGATVLSLDDRLTRAARDLGLG
ncbi:MAG: type II toxin-antitoxin system VapC family toxin [Solirubrobacteraceae bacterium]